MEGHLLHPASCTGFPSYLIHTTRCSMRHHLLLCLGTGPLKETQSPGTMLRERSYRTAHYHLPGAQEPLVETPFVGEAVLRLHPKTFSHVHLFGTVDSMWDTLYLHFTNPAPGSAAPTAGTGASTSRQKTQPSGAGGHAGAGFHPAGGTQPGGGVGPPGGTTNCCTAPPGCSLAVPADGGHG